MNGPHGGEYQSSLTEKKGNTPVWIIFIENVWHSLFFPLLFNVLETDLSVEIHRYIK
jgi:hypothetical protein